MFVLVFYSGLHCFGVFRHRTLVGKQEHRQILSDDSQPHRIFFGPREFSVIVGKILFMIGRLLSAFLIDTRSKYQNYSSSRALKYLQQRRSEMLDIYTPPYLTHNKLEPSTQAADLSATSIIVTRRGLHRYYTTTTSTTYICRPIICFSPRSRVSQSLKKEP